MKKQVLAILAILFLSTSAHALFEFRVGYGVNTPSEDTINDPAGNVDLSTMTGFNLDAIVTPPMLPIGLGIRYENMGFDATSSGVDFSSNMTRLALIVNYRLIDTLIYFGAIGTVGFSNEVTVEIPGFADSEYDADLTYSIGAEAGVSLGLFSVGAELGYNIATYENTNLSPSEIDFDGVYAKAIVGVGF